MRHNVLTSLQFSPRAEVDLAALVRNLGKLRRLTRPGACFMAVVKADAYGHGALEVARQALLQGAEWLGVARIDEAVELRQAGLTAPVLIFGHTPPELSDVLVEHKLTQTVYSLQAAEQLSVRASTHGKRIDVHVKVDTGMSRLGLLTDRPARRAHSDNPGNPVREVLSMANLPGLRIEGIYTHFAAADRTDTSDAQGQLERFLDFIDRLRGNGLEFPLRHAANSAALLGMPEAHLDLVRCGIAMYGLYPSEEIKSGSHLDLEPVMQLKSSIVDLKDLPAGTGISYGGTYKTPQPTTIATVSLGYADGLSRRLSSRGHMLVGGRKVPIVGRVCMDLVMLDVGSVPDVSLGDEVVAFGSQEGSSLAIDEIAAELGTITYEIVTRISGRVPRVYLR